MIVKIYKMLKLSGVLLVVVLNSACVAYDRMNTKITDHTHHPSFTYQDVVEGGVLVAGLLDVEGELDLSLVTHDMGAIEGAIMSSREKYRVRTAEDIVSIVGESRYRAMLESYRGDRWVEPDMLALIRDQNEERYVIFARIDSTSQRTSTSSSKREKEKKEEEKEGEKKKDKKEATRDIFTDLITHSFVSSNSYESSTYESSSSSGYSSSYEEDTYDVYRKKYRGATISADVFDLAQDIIVWSGTRSSGYSNSEKYVTSFYIDDEDYLQDYPYPNYPSWYSIYRHVFEGLVIHMPHKSDRF